MSGYNLIEYIYDRRITFGLIHAFSVISRPGQTYAAASPINRQVPIANQIAHRFLLSGWRQSFFVISPFIALF